MQEINQLCHKTKKNRMDFPLKKIDFEKVAPCCQKPVVVSIFLLWANSQILAMERGTRLHLLFPSSWYENDWNWDKVEEIQMQFRGNISSDLFCTLRFDFDEPNEKLGYLDIIKL